MTFPIRKSARKLTGIVKNTIPEVFPEMKPLGNVIIFPVNLAAVWGQMSTGGGHSKLEEILSVIGVPVMTKKSFIGTQRDIGETWRCALKQSMMKTGQREREIAIQKGNFHEGVPTITVIVDGGWSTRVH